MRPAFFAFLLLSLAAPLVAQEEKKLDLRTQVDPNNKDLVRLLAFMNEPS